MIRSYLILLAIVTCFGVPVTYSQGCCSGGGGSPIAGGAAMGVLEEGQMQLLSSYQYSRSNKFMSGDRDTTAFFDNLSSNYLFFKADYGLSSKLTVSVATGFYPRRTITEFADTTFSGNEIQIENHQVSSSGIGDFLIFPRYNVYSNTRKSIHSELTLGVGLKMALGKHDDSTFIGHALFLNTSGPTPFIDSNEIWQLVPPTIQSTTGSNDLMFSAFYLRNYEKRNFKLLANGLFIHKGWNSLGIKFGNYASIGFSAGTTIFDRLNLIGQIKGEWVGLMQTHEDIDVLSAYNIDLPSTGSRMLSFVPQISYLFKKPQISVFGTADIPLYQYMNGTQIATQYLITGGVSYRFQLKKKTEVPKIPQVEQSPVVYREETFKVWGNCGMCKETIESTLSSLAGVQFAEWDKRKQILHIRFDSLKLKLEDIKVELANVGYDTKTHKATEEAYNGLHECCKYERSN
ncbi:MAG: hypothetical protein Crog4KO_16420 [Crocinitomicaceae bacterium]